MRNNNIPYSFEDRYNNLIERDGSHERDIERKALFHILAGNTDLYSKVDYIYDFEEKGITPECLESGEIDFCSSSRKLIKLAYNLFNGYPADVLDTLYILDDKNLALAFQAMKIRVNYSDSSILTER